MNFKSECLFIIRSVYRNVSEKERIERKRRNLCIYISIYSNCYLWWWWDGRCTWWNEWCKVQINRQFFKVINASHAHQYYQKLLLRHMCRVVWVQACAPYIWVSSSRPIWVCFLSHWFSQSYDGKMFFFLTSTKICNSRTFNVRMLWLWRWNLQEFGNFLRRFHQFEIIMSKPMQRRQSKEELEIIFLID